jgi:alpha-ribazole phosphatase
MVLSFFKFPTIIFMRHAESTWNVLRKVQGGSINPDIILSPAGRLSVHTKLAHTPKPQIIISSPLIRCKQTAEEWLGQPPHIINDDLAEINAGKYEGLSIDDLQADHLWQQWMTNPLEFPGFPEGENLATFAQRVLFGAAKICEEYGDAKHQVVVVTHGVTMRVFKCFLANQSLQHLWSHQVGNLEQIGLSKAQIKKFQVGNIEHLGLCKEQVEAFQTRLKNSHFSPKSFSLGSA